MMTNTSTSDDHMVTTCRMQINLPPYLADWQLGWRVQSHIATSMEGRQPSTKVRISKHERTAFNDFGSEIEVRLGPWAIDERSRWDESTSFLFMRYVRCSNGPKGTATKKKVFLLILFNFYLFNIWYNKRFFIRKYIECDINVFSKINK